MSDLDKAIRAKLALSSPDHPRSWNELAYAKALGDLLDWANGLESDFEGNPSNVGKAFAEQVRTVIATSLGVSGENRSEPTPARLPGCWCARCHPATGFRVMNLCPDCGNKRCPRATHHIHECTGSNEPGQPGSDYVNIRRIERVAADPTSEVVTPEGPA